MSILQALIPRWTGAADPDAIPLDKAKRGDRSAFDILRRTHDKQLRGFVIRRGSAEHAEDIIQDIWIACWQTLPRYAGKARFKTWLYGIAAHKCTDYLRLKVQNDQRNLDQECEEPIQPDAYAAIELKQVVRDALAQVPEAQREVLELYYYAELNLAEIAQALDRNLNTVKYQFYRAHDQVALLLKSEDSEKR